MPSFKRKRIPEYQGTGKRFKSVKRSAVSNLTRKVNKILSEQERKNFDTVATVTLAANVAQIQQLINIPQGDDATSRDGRKVAKVSSHMRYNIKGGSTGLTATRPFRVIVIHDNQPNGLTPVVADILTAPTNIRSPLTMDFKERFRVIHDNFCAYKKGFYTFGANTSATDINIPCEYFFKFPDMLAQTEYGGIGNVPTTGSLFVLLIAEDTTLVDYYHRLRFTDS